VSAFEILDHDAPAEWIDRIRDLGAEVLLAAPAP